MDKIAFEHEMNRAKTFQALETDRAEYWTGYARGLRRAYHGERFGTEQEHAQWMEAADSEDVLRRQRGQGYRDGLKGSPRRSYCTQNDGDCLTYTLVSYGRDCRNVLLMADEPDPEAARRRRETILTSRRAHGKG